MQSRLLLVALSVCAAACEFLTGNAVREWSEDVVLEGGDVVTIDRRVEFTKTNSISGDSYGTVMASSTLSIRSEGVSLYQTR